MSARAIIESSISHPHEMATFLAAVSPHSGDWLLALPVTSRVTGEAVRVAVALHLCVCVADTSRCGAIADAEGMHGFVCRQAPSK